MLTKKQAKAVFDATNQNSNMFNIFYQILSEAYSPLSTLAELIGQIITIINNPASILFDVKSGSLYEYKPLQESKEALKYVYDLAKQIENLIDTEYLPVLGASSDRSVKELSGKLTKADEFVLKTKARALAQKMVNFQNNNADGNNTRKLQDEFNKKLAEGTSDTISKASKALDEQTVKFKNELDKWKRAQLTILENKLTKMVPERGYSFAFRGKNIKKISPQIGKQQAMELAKKIVELVYNTRLDIFKNFKKQPTGGLLGNAKGGWLGFKGEMQCSDWTALFYEGLKENIKQYYEKNLNSFRIEWRRTPPWLYHHFEHNYIRITGPNDYLVLDPWKSGGEKIIPQKERSTSATGVKNNIYVDDQGNIFAYPKGNNF